MKIKNGKLIIPTILTISLLTACTSDAQGNIKKFSTTTSSSNVVYAAEASEVTTSASTEGTATTEVTNTVDISNALSTDDYYFDWKSRAHETIDLSKGSTTITKSGIYELTGTLGEGSITINIDKSVDKGTLYLVLNNANINSTDATPINIIEAKKAVILLENDTTNTITQGAIVTENTEFPSATIFSKTDLTITGTGILNVTTEYNDGITSKDDFLITDGIINIKSAGDGLVGKDLLLIEKTTLFIDAGKDGIRTTNATDEGKGNLVILGGTFTITSANDAIQAEKILEIKDGTFTLTTGGGYPGKSITTNTDDRINRGMVPAQTTEIVDTTTTESLKAVKAGGDIIISGGIFNILAYDDAIHSNSSITINGGVFDIQTGDDAIHADNEIIINAGEINIKNSYEGIEGGFITINNGKIDIVSSDDGINANLASGALNINGGEIYIKSIGDAIDSNGNIVQTGGKVVIDTTLIGQADSAVDYDGTFTGTGGTITDQNGNAISHQGGMPGGGRGMAPDGTMPRERGTPADGTFPKRGVPPTDIPSENNPITSEPLN